MSGIKNLLKNSFLAQFKIVQIFTIFARSAPVEFPSKFNFPKIASNFVETFPLMSGIKNLLKKIVFLASFKIVQNFHYFCKVHACRISIKNSILEKLPKIL